MAETVEGPQLYGDPNELGPGQYKALGTDPQSESIRMAIFGYNPATGKAFTPAESAAASGGYLPENYRDVVGYDFDPETNQLTVLNKQGMASGLGARFQQTGAGTITPKLSDQWGAFKYDEQGRPVNAQGLPITQEDINKYNELVQSNPQAAREFAQGKGITGNAITSGSVISNTPQGLTSGTTNRPGASGVTNPYVPGTAAFTAFGERESAYNLLYQQMAAYGLQSLVDPLKNLVLEGISPSEFTIRLRDTDAYKKRFAANQARINKGLRALSEAEYIGVEDQYQDVMRRYGLPDTYYARGEMGRQEGFEKFIGGDVSPVELEDRIVTAQDRVIKSNPEVSKALREFYPEITGGDILAYALDPDKAITNIKRKIGAAEIGAGAMQAGLQTGLARAEELQRYGVTKDTARQGFGTIASGLERGRQLSNIYQQPDYTQQVAETEVFALPDAEKARRQRRRLGQLETATFSGTTGMTGGALDRERAGQY
jgi:hypothetical protein